MVAAAILPHHFGAFLDWEDPFEVMMFGQSRHEGMCARERYVSSRSEGWRRGGGWCWCWCPWYGARLCVEEEVKEEDDLDGSRERDEKSERRTWGFRKPEAEGKEEGKVE
jgi:hypothetical protein